MDKYKQNVRKKNPIIYILITLVISALTFCVGNFLDNNHLIKTINPVTILFGQTTVELTEYYNPKIEQNDTIILFDIKNVGDKKIDNLNILYSFCGLEQKKVNLNKLKLDLDEVQSFYINIPIKLNTTCSVITDKVKVDVYEDNERNCYLDFENKKSKVCEYCKINFEVYGNNKHIPSNTIWYPFLDVQIDASAMMRYFYALYSLGISWKDGYKSECKVLSPTSSKTNLNLKEPLYTSFIDSKTMCLRGDDLEWCKQNYYTKT